MSVKTIVHPETGRRFKLGRRAPVARGPRLSLKKYLLPTGLPLAPLACDYSAGALPVLSDVFMNDELGDCVIAGGYHIAGMETANDGAPVPFHATKAQILADYSAIGGYVAGDESTDNGCDEVTAMNYWTHTGFADGTKLTGYLAVDPTDRALVESALYLFENLFFGIGLPDAWINPAPSATGFTWDVAGAADPNNGHCVIGVGYTSAGVVIDSWGMLGTIAWAAVAEYCAEANGGQLFTMLSPDQINKAKAAAPNGFDWAQLVSDFDAIGGNVQAIQ